MSQPPLDTLKMRAYGVKNPVHVKQEKQSQRTKSPAASNIANAANPTSSSARYYPKSKDGNYDEWAAVLASQYEAATKQDQDRSLQKRTLIKSEYGRSEYLQGLERKKQDKLVHATQIEQERCSAQEKLKALHREDELKLAAKRKIRDQALVDVEKQIIQTSGATIAKAAFEKEMTLKMQEDRIRTLTKTEQEQKQMRYEWRKMLEEGYEKDMKEFDQKVKDEQAVYHTGPTTIEALGSHYQQQLARLKKADQKMADRADRVAQVINTPSLKDRTQDVMGRTIDAGTDGLKDSERRQTLIEQSKENLQRHLALKEQLKKYRDHVHLEPHKSLAPNQDDLDLARVHEAQVWRSIEKNLHQYKMDSQKNYKQLLDQQVEHKKVLVKQGNMTQMEKSLNRGELQDYKSNERKIHAMVPGICSESPLRSAALPKKRVMAGKISKFRSEKVSPRGSSQIIRAGLHYNENAPPGHWRPQHKRVISLNDFSEGIKPEPTSSLEFAIERELNARRGSESPLNSDKRSNGSSKSKERPAVAQSASQVRKINKKRLATFNKNLLTAQAQVKANQSQVGSKVSGTQAPTRTNADGKTSLLTGSVAVSRMSMGKVSTMSRRSKAVPLDALFKSDVVSVKDKNENMSQFGGEKEPQRFGRWLMNQESEKSNNAGKYRSQSVLAPINEVQQVEPQKMIGQRNMSLAPMDFGKIALKDNKTHGGKSSKVHVTFGEREVQNISRLEQLGLDHKNPVKQANLNGGKLLDQMQPHRDLSSYFTRQEGGKTNKLDFKRLSQHRVQQMPLGGLLGERNAKSVSLYAGASQKHLPSAPPAELLNNDLVDQFKPSLNVSGRLTPGRIRAGGLSQPNMEIILPASHHGHSVSAVTGQPLQIRAQGNSAIPMKNKKVATKEKNIVIGEIPNTIEIKLQAN